MESLLWVHLLAGGKGELARFLAQILVFQYRGWVVGVGIWHATQKGREN